MNVKNKLCNYVDILENNETCVVLKVKSDKKDDLVKLGYFEPNENMYRLTKGSNHTCTVFKDDGSNFSWEWGESGHTLVSDSLSKKGHLIEECITEDFDIYIGKNKQKIEETMNIFSLSDTEDKTHLIEFMYWKKDDDRIVAHKDGEFYKVFNSISEGIEHFDELGYSMEYNDKVIAGTGCFVETYKIDKNKNLDYEMEEL